MPAPVAPPWEQLADAYDGLTEAERHGTADDIAVSLAAVAAAKDACGALGGLLVMMALDHAGYAVQRRLGVVFNALAQGAWDRATRAGDAAVAARHEVDALRDRVRELEGAVAKLTPGVGDEPVKLRVVG